MQLKHYCLAKAAAMLLAMISFQSSQAASITYDTSGNSNVNLDKIQYTHGDRVGESWVIQPTVLQRGGTPGARRLLQKHFPDWTFLIAPPVEGDSSLKGEFKIKQYYACDNVTDCGVPSTFPINYGVGALLDLDFIPGLGDPSYDGEFEYKWIGRVTSSHSQLPSPNGSYGLIEERIDNNGQTDNPFAVLTDSDYYGVPNYYDRPYRGNPQDNHYWNSELFLAREIGTKTAVIYDGISWGWENETMPNPACSDEGTQCPPPPPECTGGSGGGGCAINAAIYDEKLSDNKNNSSTSIPESTSVLGLLTLGVWGVSKAFKIRFNK